MRIAADNKITSTNSWTVALIDFFADLDILRKGRGEINFQKASCTLSLSLFSYLPPTVQPPVPKHWPEASLTAPRLSPHKHPSSTFLSSRYTQHVLTLLLRKPGNFFWPRGK
ncbi:hypothetical protein M427DRAFT_61621 [Gonapodya prolifera JEL478]|uniref:Condensin complex subunit 2 n=1 Tax=Gonapodya prolifera (strain JEL478) TaxID=1344416 RepID=A0A139A1R8_GONPJ|nr:hypothetical protein M427DRAFT_61621 [Gonapodya prolifera JEL478]|eukprot:KXS10684.1 hypothetical protein M427DRAFT_61621 [Gonapodya prolifera JEL478]